VHSTGPRLPKGRALGKAVLTPRSLGIVDPGVTVLRLSGYPGVPYPPVNYRQEEGSVEEAYSRVVAMNMLL
jgi:hypothetical protein